MSRRLVFWTLASAHGVVGSPRFLLQKSYDNSLFIDYEDTTDATDITTTLIIETTTNSSTNYPEDQSVNTWSIMWYLISFGGLILFFLLVSFSEVCCKKTASPFATEDDSAISRQPSSVVSPPGYEEFAPPTYESLFGEKDASNKNTRSGKKMFGVFVVPMDDKAAQERSLEFGEVISRNAMGDGEVVTPPPPP